MPEFWKFRRARPVEKARKTLIMGIVNLTPDSFSGAGAPQLSPADAAEVALKMLADGADIIDFGAESTRPGASPVTAGEELRRLGNVVALVRARTDAPLSVDTYHPETAAEMLEQGADIINDVTALRGGWESETAGGRDMASLVASSGAHIILMHSSGEPRTMQNDPVYEDVVETVRGFLRDRTQRAVAAGIPPERIWLDPGFGFGKNFSHNSSLLLRLGEICEDGFPVIAGMSRKRMICDALGLPPQNRLEAGLALAVLAAAHGAALVRVHDVLPAVRAVGMADAILRRNG